MWEFATGKEQRSIDVPQLSAYRRVEDIEWGGIRAIALSPDGNTLVACGSNEYSGPACALLFDVATGELKRKLSSTLKGFYYSAQFHPQGFLLTAGGDIGKGEFRAWDPNKDESLSDGRYPRPLYLPRRSSQWPTLRRDSNDREELLPRFRIANSI